MEVKELSEKLMKAVKDVRDANEIQLKEIKERGEATAASIQKIEGFNTEIDAIKSQMKAIETSLARSGSGEGDKKGSLSAEQKATKEAFRSFMRKGVLNTEEAKALSVNSDPDGGFLVLPEMSSEIVKKVFESSPMRALASVQTISSDRLEMIEDLDEAASGWVAETAARPETNTPQFNKIIIPVHELYAFPKASQKILDDAMINVEQWLVDKVVEKFGRDEATAFVSGNGMGKPKGFLDYAAGTTFGTIQQVNSGDADEITDEGLINLFYALKGAYKANSSWLMRRASVASVRLMKGTDGHYLWEPSLQMGSPDMLLGRPLYEAADMPAEGANALAVAFGDFKAGYQIVDRFGVRVIRDNLTAKPYVGFYTTKRVGGDVKNFEAIKLLKCAV